MKSQLVFTKSHLVFMKSQLAKLIFASTFLFSLLVPIDSQAVTVNKEVESKIQSIFGDKAKIAITPYKEMLLEISLGAKTYFASLDGQFIFAGPIIDTQDRVNIVEQKQKQYRQQRLSELSSEMYLSFPASTEARHTVTLFTDIDCTYCRKFHSYMDEFNEKGVTVNYVMLPRAGVNSSSYHKAASVFCSSNPQENMTLAMKDAFNEQNSCKHKITEQMQLAMEFEVNSTPTMVLPDGEIQAGLITPDKLMNFLNLQ